MPYAPRAHQPRHQAARPKRIDRRASAAERGYDSRWAKLRAAFIASNPICWHCLGYKRVEQADEIDHIVPVNTADPLSDPLRLDENNLQPLCRRHHALKTARQYARASMPTVVVAGPPCSGKTTYVAQHAKPGDFVWDHDAVAAAITHHGRQHSTPEWCVSVVAGMRDDAIKRFLGQCPEAGCWIITSRHDDAKRCASQYRARLHLMETTIETCLDRARSAGRWGATEAIKEWERGDEGWGKGRAETRGGAVDF